jgi:hypothetical protein
MTTWEVKKAVNSSRFYLVRTDENGTTVLPGFCDSIHSALIEIGEFLSPYDIVKTSVANVWVLPKTGEPNN